MDFLFHLFVVFIIYAMVACGQNLVTGYARILSVSQATFFGVGAYTGAIFSARFDISMLTCVLLGGVFVLPVALLVASPAIRVKDDFYAVVTLGLQVVFTEVIKNSVYITGGPLGISGISPVRMLGYSISTPQMFIWILIPISTVVFLIYARVTVSPFAVLLRGSGEDALFAETHGVNVSRLQLKAFLLSSVIASIAGVLYAHYFLYVSPQTFSYLESVMILAMVIVGGSGSRWGFFIGAGVLVVLPEALRFLGFSGTLTAKLRQIFFGFALIGVVLWWPSGILRSRPVFRWRNRRKN